MCMYIYIYIDRTKIVRKGLASPRALLVHCSTRDDLSLSLMCPC